MEWTHQAGAVLGTWIILSTFVPAAAGSPTHYKIVGLLVVVLLPYGDFVPISKSKTSQRQKSS